MRGPGIRVAGGRAGVAGLSVVRRRGGTIGSVGWCGDPAARSGITGRRGGDAGRGRERESRRRVYCQEVAWRGKEHPSTLLPLSAAFVRTHSTKQSQSGASPRIHPIYIASGTPHNPSTPGLSRVTGHDDRDRDRNGDVDHSGYNPEAAGSRFHS